MRSYFFFAINFVTIVPAPRSPDVLAITINYSMATWVLGRWWRKPTLASRRQTWVLNPQVGFQQTVAMRSKSSSCVFVRAIECAGIDPCFKRWKFLYLAACAFLYRGLPVTLLNCFWKVKVFIFGSLCFSLEGLTSHAVELLSYIGAGGKTTGVWAGERVAGTAGRAVEPSIALYYISLCYLDWDQLWTRTCPWTRRCWSNASGSRAAQTRGQAPQESSSLARLGMWGWCRGRGSDRTPSRSVCGICLVWCLPSAHLSLGLQTRGAG